VIAFILQGGNLALLAVVLGGLYRLIRAALPLLSQGVEALAAAEKAFARLEGKVDALSGRGVCPMLAARDEGRGTEPELPRG